MTIAPMPAEKAKRTVLAIEIPRDELAVRIAMQIIHARPAAGISATQALAEMDKIAPNLSADFLAAADAAVFYLHERINAGVQTS